MVELFAKSGDPDQMPQNLDSVASDLGLHCLPITLLGVSRLQWVKCKEDFVCNLILWWRHCNAGASVKEQKRYGKILQRCGIEEIGKKGYQKLRTVTGFKHVQLQHDNAPAHMSAIVCHCNFLLQKENETVLLHPLYSPDLAPCNFFLLSKLKTFLTGKRYRSRQTLGSAVYHTST